MPIYASAGQAVVRPRGLVTAAVTLQALVATGQLCAAAPRPDNPQLLSPAGTWASPGLAERCPTFSWAGDSSADGYELVVVRVAAGHDASADALVDAIESSSLDVVVRRPLPSGATTWTPDLRACLEAGESYAWSLRVTGAEQGSDSGESAWSEPQWLDVTPAPSFEEVERALDVLARYTAAHGSPSQRSSSSHPEPASDTTTARGATPAGISPSESLRGPSADTPRNGVAQRDVSAATTPVHGLASITVANQLHLSETSSVFKGGQLFLWDALDVHGTLALGRGALRSIAGGEGNTAIGYRALGANVDGDSNTALGEDAMRGLTSGEGNVAVGGNALANLETGDFNIAIGAGAGQTLVDDQHSNILLNNAGSLGDFNTLRIGMGTGTQHRELIRTIIHGIQGRPAFGGGATVFVDAFSQLGTTTCGSYVPASVCPRGDGDGPTCDTVPAGSFCEADGECSIADLNNCAGFDWYLRVE